MDRKEIYERTYDSGRTSSSDVCYNKFDVFGEFENKIIKEFFKLKLSVNVTLFL